MLYTRIGGELKLTYRILDVMNTFWVFRAESGSHCGTVPAATASECGTLLPPPQTVPRTTPFDDPPTHLLVVLPVVTVVWCPGECVAQFGHNGCCSFYVLCVLG